MKKNRSTRQIRKAVILDFKITPVKSSEVPELLKLIRELAKFEKLEHEMKATSASLRRALFGPRPMAGALLARSGGKATGYALYFTTFSSFTGKPGLWLDDLYVSPEFRRCGLGRALIEAVAVVAAKRKCGRFEWIALDWNHRALDFYKSLGAKTLDEWVLIRMDERGLRRLGSKRNKAKERVRKIA